MANITRPCANCGKEITRSASTKRDGTASGVIYCNRSCYDMHRHKIRHEVSSVPCANCGVNIPSSTSEIKKGRKYCSHECRVIHKKAKPKNCVNCNTLFTPVKLHKGMGRMISHNAGKTCSPQCHNLWIRNNEERKRKISKAFTGDKHPNWQGGVSRGYGSYRGENWRSQRAKAKKRDGNKCIICGITNEDHLDTYGNGLHVNHIIPFHNFTDYKKANALSNLETLCVKHHGMREDRSNVQMCMDFSDGDKHQRIRVGYAAGSKHPRAKLTESDVIDILAMRSEGLSYADISDRYDAVSKSTISAICLGKTWNHVKRQSAFEKAGIE